ncbi:PRC-barrel domain-containing protein [Mycolicibacterium neoaurum]|uniref:PRC-barrel domain-containing protein n=1 Tax=Mycolicibacterium neoaurum TaxID=1795 RepID=UPI001F4D2A4F|nr:PRC-barrel domain-containing protein [Mycolicibacterium neoaurum]
MATLVEQYVGATVYDVAGEKIGKIDKLFVDDKTRDPKWALVRSGFLGMSHAVVPLKASRRGEGAVTVTVTKDAVKDAPTVHTDEGITIDEADQLSRHFRLDEEHPEAPEPPPPSTHSSVLDIASAAAGIGGTAVNTAAYTDTSADEHVETVDTPPR